MRSERAVNRLTKIGLMLAGLVAALIIAEVGLRLMGINMIEGLEIAQSDPGLGWKYRPNEVMFACDPQARPECVTIRTNNQALREDSDTRFEKSPGLQRILVLGDSQTAGALVSNSETYANLLEELLNDNSDDEASYEVLNSGVAGYSLVQEWLQFRETGVQYEPDVVVVGVYVGNDLLDMVEIAPRRQPHYERTRQKTLQLRDYPLNLGVSSGGSQGLESVKEILRPFYVYRMVRYSAKYSSLLKPLRDAGLVQPEETHHASKKIEGDRRPLAASICRGCVLQSLSQSYYFASLPEQEEIAVSMVEEVLRQLKTETDAANTRLIVLVIPSRLQVEPELDAEVVGQTIDILGYPERAADFDQHVYEEILRYARLLDIEVLDVLPAMIAAHQEFGARSLYFSGDWHLTPLGHRVLAMQLYEALWRPRKTSHHSAFVL